MRRCACEGFPDVVVSFEACYSVNNEHMFAYVAAWSLTSTSSNHGVVRVVGLESRCSNKMISDILVAAVEDDGWVCKDVLG